MNRKNEKSIPYPGLRYYEDHHVGLFAGRQNEAIKCTQELGTSKLLVLHGRSGCGKSSFLRAGVKPLIEQSIPGSRFNSGDAGFEVIRSTDNPLSAFADMMFRVCDELVKYKRGSSWQPKDAVTEEQLEQFAKYYARYAADGENIKARSAYRVLCELSDLLKPSPLFVIDQAEEVFTLIEKRQRKSKDQKEEPEGEEDERRLDWLQDRRSEYFRFLGRVATDGARRAKLIISLRTEYKGHFDDLLAKRAPSATGVVGFYLEDLSVDGLISAIERPTLDADSYASALGFENVPDDRIQFEGFDFSYADGVSAYLARLLKYSDQVPVGGVLPTLQIACLRLWKQASAAAGEGKGRFTITRQQVDRLGPIDQQFQEYVDEVLHEECIGFKWPGGATNAVENWQGLLNENLVEVQADGRAVSTTIEKSALIKSALSLFIEEGAKDKVVSVVDRLCEPEVALLNENKAAKSVSLGHDSIALSLNKWSVRHNRDDSMMRRMNMGMAQSPDDFNVADLFPKGKRPFQEEVTIHTDLHWDRMFLQFAHDKKFTERLRIKLDSKRPELDVSRPQSEGGPKNWEKLTLNLRKAGQDAKRAWKKENKKSWVLVAADWQSFPWVAGESDKDDEWKADQLGEWSDIVVTDLFVGNGLIGQAFEAKNSLKEAENKPLETRGRVYKEVIKETLNYLAKEKGVVAYHDDLARQFLIRAAELACGLDSNAVRHLRSEESVHKMCQRDFDHVGDPLVDWLMSERKKKDDRPRFIVGTAASRAIALQAGNQLFFSTSQVTMLTRKLMNDIVDDEEKEGKDKDEKLGNLVSQIQDVIKHTTWQLSLPPARWNQGRNRAFVLRLASLGYCTAEYIRSNPDEFVMYVRERLNKRLESLDTEGEGSYKGARISRDAVRNAIRDCYSIMKFDEAGTEFYDLDSTTAYFTRHGEYDSKSVAGEIYNELSSLRQRTISNYENFSRIVSWIRTNNNVEYDAADPDIKRAINLKKIAWNNYRIFNFYDSARFMAEATLIMQQKIENL